MKYSSKFLRQIYLDFFKSKGHTIIKSASLIPDNDPTVLFTTAGMHPLIPYLLGEKHPGGTRLANVQKCVRTVDIEEVGDGSHCTFFEMLGNWSLGDYFKKQSIEFSYEFLTGKEWLGLDKNKLAVTVFEGDGDCERDEESAKAWLDCGIAKDRIFYLPKKHNWWIAGTTGPCGPDTEIFYDTGKEPCCGNCSPACSCGKYLEIWNNVFMQFNKLADGSYVPLKQKNVDTGMGLERVVRVLNGFESVYEIDAFLPAVQLIEKLSGKSYGADQETTRAMRIIADHVRTAVFIMGDVMGVTPSNTDKGYILRRLIRRAVRYAQGLGIAKGGLTQVAGLYIENYTDAYPELTENKTRITEELYKEEEKFLRTLAQGEKEFYKVLGFIKDGVLPGSVAFKLYDTFGFPLELTIEYAKEKGFSVDTEGYHSRFKIHQEVSKAEEGTFKGGLADSGVETTRLHTATHLLLKSLRAVLGADIKQRGSNITPERLRFDFSFDRPLTEEEIKKVEDMVNDAIKKDYKITFEEMSVEEAKKRGAIGTFGDRYGEVVKVYSMGDFSREICGGPHADSTGELGKFLITKEQSSSSGVRRIRGELKSE